MLLHYVIVTHKLINIVTTEPEGLVSIISMSTFGHNPKLVPLKPEPSLS